MHFLLKSGILFLLIATGLFYFPFSHDYKSYTIFQDFIANGVGDTRFGFLFILIFKIINSFGFINLLDIHIAIVILIQFLIISKYSDSWVEFYLILISFYGLYLLLLDATQIRESIVLTIILLLILKKGEFKSNFLLSFISFNIHYSGIIFLINTIKSYKSFLFCIFSLLIFYLLLASNIVYFFDTSDLFSQYFKIENSRSYTNIFFIENTFLIYLMIINRYTFDFSSAILLLGNLLYLFPISDLVAHRVLEISLIGVLGLYKNINNSKFLIFISLLPLIIFININLLGRTLI